MSEEHLPGNGESGVSDLDGRLIDVDGTRSVRFVRTYPTTREDVWDAITDPDRLARWAFRGTFEPRVGGAMHFDYGEAGGADGTVLAWDPPRVLEYEWAMDTDMGWRIRFELADGPDGSTVLTFDHFLPDAARPEFAAGWHWHLDRLADLVAGGSPAEVDSDAHFDALLGAYQRDGVPVGD